MAKQVRTQNRYARIMAVERSFPYFVLNGENISISMEYREEIEKIVKYYDAYNNGADFTVEGSGGSYISSMIAYKTNKNLIDKEARFMFSHVPDVNITTTVGEGTEEQIEAYKKVINKVIEKNNFGQKLLRAAKDCFIGKRVACLVNMSDRVGIMIHFYTSLEFYYERDYQTNEITRFISFENKTKSGNTSDRRFLINKYTMENDTVYVESYLSNGIGEVVETYVQRHATDLKKIPVVVICNDGLLSDEKGVSDISGSMEYESGYSRIANADIDAGRKGMNPIRYTVDMNPETTKNLPSGPGAYWDLETNQLIDDTHTQVGQLAPAMNHTSAISSTLDRLRAMMYESMDIPDISKDGLLSGITSFKALKALYYPLENRCDEKLMIWKPAIREVMENVIAIAILNENVTKELYIVSDMKEIECNIEIVENYAIIDDETEEKRVDMEEMTTKSRSIYSYLKKWRGDELKTDEDIENEILRIAEESAMMDTLSMDPQVKTKQEEQQTEQEVENMVEEEETGESETI